MSSTPSETLRAAGSHALEYPLESGSQTMQHALVDGRLARLATARHLDDGQGSAVAALFARSKGEQRRVGRGVVPIERRCA